MRPLFALGLMAIAALAAIGAESLTSSTEALPMRVAQNVLVAEGAASPWRAAGLGGESAWAHDAMAPGVTLEARGPGGTRAVIHVTPAPQGGLLLLSETGRWAYAADPAELARALDVLAASARPQPL